MRLPTDRPPIHPGEILLEEFLKPYRMTVTDTALRTGLRKELVQDIVDGKKNIDADMALRLSRLFSTSPELWMSGQIAWDIWHILNSRNAGEIEKIEPVII
ncbi:MAG: HigA family addiction module antitoxin [Desulfococcaceae bacterium]|jgi:addiction module HigA family antidote|nr:HigA family addiction module antitoxin [Desulfococcaceae bacterium]